MRPTPAELARAFGDTPYPQTAPPDAYKRRVRNRDSLPRLGLGPGALAREDRPSKPPPPRPRGSAPF